MFHLSSALSLLAAASLASASPVVVDQRSVVPRHLDQGINFVGVSYSGSGCPPNSITTGNIDYENYQFQYFYQNLTASISPDSPKVNVDCRVELTFNTTTATQLIVLGGTYKGHVDIEKGVYAKEENQYKFKGNSGVADMDFVFKGPLNVDTEFTNVLNITLESGCASAGGEFTLVVHNYLTLTTNPDKDGPGNGSGSIEVSELDQGVRQSIQLASQGC